MDETYFLRDLYQALRRDSWRKDHPFSDDVATVNDLLFDTYADNWQRVEQLSYWLQKQQPCLFGRVAAATGSLHFCVLTERDFLGRSDQSIAQTIRRDLRDWKRRSARPSKDFSDPAFGFVLIAAAPHLVNAAPDDHLQAFAHKLRDLWGCQGTEEVSGTMHWETLYLRHPESRHYVRFTFSVDFFAAQGDGRWWHDHRSPGGLMFTANSVGHMQKYREWYWKMPEQGDWVLQTAMLTIDEAATTPYGEATWLRALSSDRRPVSENVACPFVRQDRLKPQLTDKDWTKYGGWLHTDHSIRPEFFNEDPQPHPDVTAKEYLQDFTYLYQAGSRDHIPFVEGEDVSEEEVIEQLGPVGDWKDVVHRRPRQPQVRTSDAELQSDEQSEHKRRISALLDRGRQWRLSEEELRDLWGIV
jgi:hypothetical protein